MSSLLDKIRVLINARMRGPRQTPTPQAPTSEHPPAPPAAVPEVTEGRPRKSKVEVSEAAPRPISRKTPASRPATSEAPASLKQPDDLDESRVADILKRNQKSDSS